jgi:hypothetical protein
MIRLVQDGYLHVYELDRVLVARGIKSPDDMLSPPEVREKLGVPR